jgi:hypothetical protein
MGNQSEEGVTDEAFGDLYFFSGSAGDCSHTNTFSIYFCFTPLSTGSFSLGDMCILHRACNLTTDIHSSTGPAIHPFASRHEGPGFNPQGGTYVRTGIHLLALSRYNIHTVSQRKITVLLAIIVWICCFVTEPGSRINVQFANPSSGLFLTCRGKYTIKSCTRILYMHI